ncbi:hypothetical protein GCM10027610_028990 [Dactylosporangium cerinum]
MLMLVAVARSLVPSGSCWSYPVELPGEEEHREHRLVVVLGQVAGIDHGGDGLGLEFDRIGNPSAASTGWRLDARGRRCPSRRHEESKERRPRNDSAPEPVAARQVPVELVVCDSTTKGAP